MFKSYDNILVLSGAGFGIDAGLQIIMIYIEMTDEAARLHNVQPYMMEHPTFIKKIKRCLGHERIMNIF